MSSNEFVYPLAVRFGDCDPAGIAYFPRYFDWFHQAMEAWFGDALGMPYTEFILGRNEGFPAVKTESEYSKPCRFGDAVFVRMSVEEPGNSSLVLNYRVTGADPSDLRARGRTVVVMVDFDTNRSMPLPDALRQAIARFRHSAVSSNSG